MKIDTIFISSYTYIKDGIRTNGSGPVLPLINYFSTNKVANQTTVLEQPLPGSDYLTPIISIYKENDLKAKISSKITLTLGKKTKSFNSNKTYFRLKVRDLLSNLVLLPRAYRLNNKKKFNLFIGVESINAICGIIAKKLGFVDTVIYYIFDWSPNRYPNPLVNKLYILLDKFATYYSDATWNITYAIADARLNILKFNKDKMSPQIYVPYSPEFDEKYFYDVNSINTNLIIYAGGLIPENGVELLIDAFKLVVKQYPKAQLSCIGGGEQEDYLKEKVTTCKLEHAINFTGYLSDEEEILKLQSKGCIGVAPYPVMEGTRKAFGDVIKIRMYFLSALVTVTTSVPPVSKEIQEENLGLVTSNDTPEALANSILELLTNKEKLLIYRHNVINKAKKSSWKHTYTNALNQMNLSKIQKSKGRKN
ncbi:glycosyltransferase [Patescibacteria group bacterium]|nr:glycosyltransferase [Patescibacteria group bacterium]